MRTVFLRVLEADDKEAALCAAIGQSETTLDWQRFEIDVATFEAIPRSPFAYWVSERLRNVFVELSPLQADGRIAAIGASTKDDGRFLRAAWEVPHGESSYVPFAKGGAFRPFFDDIHLCIRWRDEGAEAKTFVSDYRRAHGWSPHWKAELHNPHLYFRPGLTWPRRTQGGLSLRPMPAGCIFGDKGPAVFVENDERDGLLALLAIGNSRAFRSLVDVQMAFGSYEVGVIQRTPIPRVLPIDEAALAALARRGWSLTRRLDSRNETSHAFTLPGLLHADGDSVAARAAEWAVSVESLNDELTAIHSEINARCFDLYDIHEVDRDTVTEDFGVELSEDIDVNLEEGAAETVADPTSLAAELVSWTVGVAFGRFDINLGTGARALPPEPDPFDPLPPCSPAMLSGSDGWALDRVPISYPLTFPETGILVDDPGQTRDLGGAVRSVFDAVFNADADAWWDETAALLDPKDHDLRSWLGSRFFAHHLARYSKSRRKAPILWQLSTPSGRYSVWLYAHRLTRDSFFQIQNDIVGPKLAHEERRLEDLMTSAGNSPSAKERTQLVGQETFVEELRALLDEVKRVAPLWNPSLDDGVIVTMAPLWRLLPHHRSWQDELKAQWDELAAGKHDWAHLAMHLWPERVVPKCATDRSLAIAHGLEELFWMEGTDGDWTPRSIPARPTEELVRDRASPAAKAALKSLLEAPLASTGNGRERRRRITSVPAAGAMR